MRQILFILIVLVFGSCKTPNKVVIGGDWSSYHYSYFCPAYCFSETGKTLRKLDILNANHLSLATKANQQAIKEAKAFINERGGTDFLNDISFYDIDITYIDSIENFKNKRPLYDLEKCGRTQYFIRFLYSPSKQVGYRFGIALTEDFEMISEPQFPHIQTSPDFSNIISPKTALFTAKKKHKLIIMPLQSIELTYDHELNYFVWEIESEVKTNDNTYEYQTGFVRVNATTGQIIENGIKKERRLINKSW